MREGKCLKNARGWFTMQEKYFYSQSIPYTYTLSNQSKIANKNLSTIESNSLHYVALFD
jgi:hypothetical protein